MTYVLDNAAPETGGRFAGLEACFDETTFRYLNALGMDAGWRCWELGAGGGSVARWMSERVGDQGAVLATDLNTDWITDETAAKVEVRRHDVALDDIPSSAYDIVHARLVLCHLPERDAIIPRLVSALVPGGWLVLEEFYDSDPTRPDPATDEERTFARVLDAFRMLLHQRAADTGLYPRTLPWRLEQAGLAEVGAEGRLVFTRGGTPGADVLHANLRQTADLLVESGVVSDADITSFLHLLDKPEFMFALPLMVSAWGRRPA